MNKMIRNLAAITVCLTSVTAMATNKMANNTCKNFTGPYIGGNAGYGYGTGGLTNKYTHAAQYTNDQGIRGMRGGLHGGYGQQFANKVYLGIEAAADYSNSSAKANSTGFNTFQSKRRDAYGLALRLGGVLGMGMLTYAKVGVESAKWKTTGLYETGIQTFTNIGQNRRTTGSLFGIGMETLVTKNIIVGGECAYTIYNKATNLTTNNPINVGSKRIDTFKPRTADFRLRASYKW